MSAFIGSLTGVDRTWCGQPNSVENDPKQTSECKSSGCVPGCRSVPLWLLAAFHPAWLVIPYHFGSGPFLLCNAQSELTRRVTHRIWVVGQLNCGRVLGWKTPDSGRIFNG